RVGESLLRRRVLLEPRHRRRLIFRQVALRIERRLPAFRRGERQLNASIAEYEIGGREFLKPETSRAARVPQLVVRCQDHQYFHIVLLYSSRRASRLNRATPAIIPVGVEHKSDREQKKSS